MRNLKLIAFILVIFTNPTFAQLEIKTKPLYTIFQKRPSLYLEYVINKRIGIEVGVGLIDHCTECLSGEHRRIGTEGLLAAKYYFFPKAKRHNLYLGLYTRPFKGEYDNRFGEEMVIDELSIGMGGMGGYKYVGKSGFLIEASIGVHSNELIKVKNFHSEHTNGGILRLMIGYRFNRGK